MAEQASFAEKRQRLARLLRRKEGRLPLSYAQMRLWLLDQLEPASPIYTISAVFQLTGFLRVDVLEASINAIVQRHEALRTIFLHEKGVPYQLVQAYQAIPLSVIDLEACEDDVQDWLRAEARRPFDLAKGPLFRVTLLRTSEREHLLSLSVHHILSDAWSFKLITQELATLYTDFTRGAPSSLAPLPLQFADYCVRERQWLRGDVVDEQLAYWRPQLAGPLPILQLPTDRIRQPKQTYRGALHRFYLPTPLMDGVKAFSQREGVTPFMTLLAAFQTLLYRYTGQEDMLVGSAFAGRNTRDVHDLVGFFVNTLPLRVNLRGEPSFSELLSRVRDVALGAYAHQDIPFIKLVEQVQPDRDTSYSPLVQVMFVLRQKAPVPVYRLPDLTLSRPREVDGGVAKFELSWSMEEEDDRFLSLIEYNADLFDASRIERFADHFVTLLGAAIQRPERSIAELPLLTENEQRLLIHGWNPPSSRPHSPECFHRIFEAQVAEAPDQVAVVFDNEQLTYAELDARANGLAHRLRALRVGPDVLVGICLERSLALIVSILAVFKAGGAYVPIDPVLPQERIAFLLEDARIGLVLVHRATRELLRGQPAAPALVDIDAVALADGEACPGPACDDDEGVTSRQLAYVIYTSGSTGKPKGVQVEHSGLKNMLEAQIETFGVTRHSRVLQFASISFDASIFEIVMALGSGATLVLGSQVNVGMRLRDLLERQGITHATLPPSALAHLPEGELPALRAIITAGEACPPLLVDRWAAAHQFFNAYGPTEATVWSTVARCRVGERVTLGAPIANTQIHLLDRHLQPVPIGVPGEIYIGGIGLARGYLHRPELTAQRFIDDPFGGPGSRLYRTGDLARRLEDGRIDFLGRTDDQVKVRGFRIELEEIEAVLLQHPAVREAAVLVEGEGLEEKHLVAFYVANETAPASDALRAFIKQKLPSYMVPSAFVAMAAFPRTSSLKVDRQALIRPKIMPYDRTGYCAPSNAVEEIIANIWSEILKIERVGIHDHFFELGGHSLQATQVVSRVGDAFSQSLPLSVFFERPTVAELARAIQDSEPHKGPIAPITRGPDAESHPLSFAQQRLWFLDSLTPGQAEYNIPTVIDLQGPLDEGILRACLDEILSRHEALRTRIISTDGVPRQRVTTKALDFRIVEVGHLSPERQARETQRLALQEARRAFDLANDVPIRCTLVRHDGHRHALLLTIHHIAADDRSMQILMRDLHVLYAAATAGRPPELPALPIRYRDFAQWQRQSPSHEQLAYWRQQLAHAPQPLDLPADHARPTNRSHTGDSASRLVPGALVDALQRVARRENATLFMTLLAAFNVLLYRYTGQKDILIGTPVANRGRSETENVVGFFGNTLVLRTDFSNLAGPATFREWLGRVRKTALEAYDHADVPFDLVIDALGLARDRHHPPLLQIMFALQDAAPPPSHLGDVAMSVSETDNKTAKSDLVLLLRQQQDGLAVRAQYSADLFQRSTIERLLAHFQRVLEGVAGDLDPRVDALPLLTDAEQQERQRWNATESSYPQDACVHELFEAQVERTPDALAVIWNDRQWTYRQLNEHANRLAHSLRRLGVGPEAPVGVYMDRSVEMVVGILAILKAGGVHVPLDPAYPPERIAFMLADARVSVLLTREPWVASLPPHTARVVNLDADADADALRAESAENPQHRGHGVTLDNLAYAIYTSGSTGRPKGVAISHRAILRLVVNTNYVQIEPSDRVAQASNASFDAAIFEIWGALLHGAALVGIDKEVALSPQDFTTQLQEQGITVLFLTTALFHLLANSVPGGLRSVRQVLIGGEALDGTCTNAVLAHGPPERLLNVYGPTESTTFTTTYLVPHEPLPSIVPIGMPISNTQIHLLDANLQPVPVGVSGELYIGGAGLARGYLHRPELTAERFVPHPWSTEPGARLYKTGDLARYRPDGTVEFRKRLDQQVKLRGYRIELGEIEATLREHAAVVDAVVLAREDIPGHARLVAYVVYAEAPESKRAALRAHVSGRLPSFMVPSAFIALSSLPLSPNGKVDRKRLAQVAQASTLVSEPDVPYVAPHSELEQTISRIWREVLEVERVGVHDNFFDLGGSSLLVPQAVSKLNAVLARKLPLMVLFQYPSISSLAKFLSQEAAAVPAFTQTNDTTRTMRSSRSRQGERRRKLDH